MPPFYILANQKHSEVPMMINPEKVTEWALTFDKKDLIKQDFELELHIGTFDAESATVVDLGRALLAAHFFHTQKDADFVITYNWLDKMIAKIRDAVTYLLIGKAQTPHIVDIQEMVEVGLVGWLKNNE